jgi:hypothetical protein
LGYKEICDLIAEQGETELVEKTLSKWGTGRISHPLKRNVRAVAAALEVDMDFLGPQNVSCRKFLEIEAHHCGDCEVRKEMESNHEEEHPLKETRVTKPDKKNVIWDHAFSARLIAGETPSFLECVKSSPTLVLRDSDKPGKHFFGPSVILEVTSQKIKKPVLLAYQRHVFHEDPGSRDRLGTSILFHSSFDFGIGGEEHPMDRWVRLAEIGTVKQAIENFLRLPGGELFNIMNRFKLHIPSWGGCCEPFGVATVVLPTTPKSTVYTQAVFRMTLRCPSASHDNLDVKLRALGTKNISGILRLGSVEDNFFLSPSESKGPKVLDHLVLQALRDEEEPRPYDDGRIRGIFKRGFRVI